MQKFSLANGYMPNPTLSTSILPGLMALYRKCPHPGHTLLSHTVVTPNGGEMGRKRTQIRLAAAPPPDAKTCMSWQPRVSCEDDQPLGQPLPTISAPMTPPPNQRQSPQQDSKSPHQTHSPAPAAQDRHTDSQLHGTMQQQGHLTNRQSTVM